MSNVVFELLATLGLDSTQFNKGLKDAQGTSTSIGTAIGNGFKAVGKVATLALGAAETAVSTFAISSVKAGKDFDKSMSQVAATMGLTMDEMANQTGSVELAWGTFTGNLREYAQEMGKNTAFSATQAADALNYMALAGYDAQTSMSMLPNVLNLAAAGNMDLARASDMVTDTQTAFGLTLERTSQMVDEMAKAASTGNTSVEQLGDAFLTVGGLAQELNGGMITLADGTTASVDGVQELEIALTAMANSGIKGSEAGTHMRNMLLKLASPTKEGIEAFEKLGVSVFDSTGNMRSLKDIMGDLNGAMSNLTQAEKLDAISNIFNTRDTASAEAILNAVGEDWDKIGESILNAEGAAQQMADTQLDNLAGDITLFQSALEGAQIAISDKLSPSFRDFVQLGTKGLSSITDGFTKDGLSGAINAFGDFLTEGIGLITEKLPTFISAGMQLLGAIAQGIANNGQAILFAAGDIITMFLDAMLKASESSNAGLGIINAILGTFNENYTDWISIGFQIIQNIENGLEKGIPDLLYYASEIIGSLMTQIGENAEPLLLAAASLIETLAMGLAEGLPTLIEGFAQLIVNVAQALTNPDVLTPLINSAVSILMALVNGLILALPVLIEAAPTIIESLVIAITENLSALIDAAISLIGALTQALIENAPLLLMAAVQIIFALAQGLIEALPSLLVAGYKLLTELSASFIEALPTYIDNGVKLVQALIEGILGMYQSLIRAGIDLITQFIGAIRDRFTRLRDAGKEAIGVFKDGIMQKVEEAKTWGKDLIDNFIGGIKEKWDSLKDTVSSVAGSVKDLLGFSEPKLGPLSNFHTYAPDMMQLFAKGVRDNEAMLKGVVAEAFDFGNLIATAPTMDMATVGAYGGGDFVQNININSPTALTPSEVARQTRNATRDMALELRGKR